MRRRPIRITESKLRQIIGKIIKENQDMSSPEDLDYLSDMGIDSIDDALAYAMGNRRVANESINRLMFRLIKESSSEDQKIVNAVNLINSHVKDDSPQALEKAANILSELEQEKSTRKRLKIVGAALSILGVAALFAPVLLFIISGVAGVHSATGIAAMAALGKMGGIGSLITMAAGGTAAEIGFNMDRRR